MVARIKMEQMGYDTYTLAEKVGVSEPLIVYYLNDNKVSLEVSSKIEKVLDMGNSLTAVRTKEVENGNNRVRRNKRESQSG